MDYFFCAFCFTAGAYLTRQEGLVSAALPFWWAGLQHIRVLRRTKGLSV